MEIELVFPGGLGVDAQFDGFTVHTDQPLAHGGSGSGPAPYDLFLASLASCAGFYALAFCRARGLPTEGLALRQRSSTLGGRTAVAISVGLPTGFPEKYRAALLKAVDQCKVRRAIDAGLDVSVDLADPQLAAV